MKSLQHLNKYFLKYKWLLLLGIAFTFISNLFGILPAQIVRQSLDIVLDTVDLYFLFNNFSYQNSFYGIFSWTLALFGALLLLMAALKGLFLFFVRQTLIVMSRKIEFDLKNEIYAHYQSLPLSFFRKNNTGDLMARISEDVGKVRMYVGPSIMYGINLISVFFLVFGYMFSTNTKLAFFVLLPVPFLSLSIFIVNSIIMKKSEIIQAQLSSIATFTQEAFSGIRVVKSFVKEKSSLIAFTKQSDDYRSKSLSMVRVDALYTPLVAVLAGMSSILVVYVGGLEVMAGRFTIGNITEFLMYVYMLTWPMIALGWTSSQINRAAVSQRRINEFLNFKNNIISFGNIKKTIIGDISLKNISLQYPDTGIVAIKDLSLTIKKGECIAILGTTGSGKSSIANLICRLYDTTSGEITIDGLSIKEYDVNFLRGNIGYVTQDVFLFSDTILNNVKFGSSQYSDEDCIKALKIADLYDSVITFKDGVNTVLGERGITLSGGQKQRLSIARAVVRKPTVLIFDDCLSAVDTKTEHKILSNLSILMQNSTTFIFSHRISSAKYAKNILILDNGMVVENGNHEKLMNKQGTYFTMYNQQMTENIND
ncbi:MAG: ABC transporter ATP-binding protein [Pseudarcicella sp.]|nr:ABC transporter ATP-binding protein [Pseudarcicella sp.]